MLEKEFRAVDKSTLDFIQLGSTLLNNHILIQYIGQRDILNRKIFEYDIVQTYYSDNSIRQTFFVHYIFKDCRWNISSDLIKYRRLKVIGNVFKNPYLLSAQYFKLAEQDLGISLSKIEGRQMILEGVS